MAFKKEDTYSQWVTGLNHIPALDMNGQNATPCLIYINVTAVGHSRISESV